MLSRSPTRATFCRICLLILIELSFIRVAAGQLKNERISSTHDNAEAVAHSTSAQGLEAANDLLCSPVGGCEPCPLDAINLPFCHPFGNRRLMHCVNVTEHASHSPSDPKSDPHNPQALPQPPSHDSEIHPEGEVLAWESCGRIVEKERADFYEFVAVNVVFAIVALGVLFFRSRRMALMQARQLAARIGLLREDGIRREPRL